MKLSWLLPTTADELQFAGCHQSLTYSNRKTFERRSHRPRMLSLLPSVSCAAERASRTAYPFSSLLLVIQLKGPAAERVPIRHGVASHLASPAPNQAGHRHAYRRFLQARFVSCPRGFVAKIRCSVESRMKHPALETVPENLRSWLEYSDR